MGGRRSLSCHVGFLRRSDGRPRLRPPRAGIETVSAATGLCGACIGRCLPAARCGPRRLVGTVSREWSDAHAAASCALAAARRARMARCGNAISSARDAGTGSSLRSRCGPPFGGGGGVATTGVVDGETGDTLRKPAIVRWCFVSRGGAGATHRRVAPQTGLESGRARRAPGSTEWGNGASTSAAGRVRGRMPRLERMGHTAY